MIARGGGKKKGGKRERNPEVTGGEWEQRGGKWEVWKGRKGEKEKRKREGEGRGSSGRIHKNERRGVKEETQFVSLKKTKIRVVEKRGGS